MIRSTAGGIDAMIIASHTKDHARHALPFVQAHIPIYLEKPLTDHLGEAFRFVEAIGRDRNQIQIGLQRRYDPALLYTKELLASGLIGEIREVRCILRDQFPPPPTYSSRGLIIDMGIHVADEAIFFLEEFPNEVCEIREVRCILRDQFPPPPTYSSRGLIIDMGIHVADEAIFFLEEFPNEVWASVHHTKAYHSPIDEGGDTAFVTFTTPSNVLGRLD